MMLRTSTRAIAGRLAPGLALGLTLAFACATHAQSELPPPVRPLTLMDLTDLAMRNNPATRAAWATVRQSEGARTIARAGYWPTLNASYVAQRNRSIASEGDPIPAQTRYGPSLTLSYLLLDFGTRGGTADQAASQLLATQLSRDQSLQDLALTVESAYYGVIGSRALEEARRRSLTEADANTAAARTRHDAGLATIADRYQAEAASAAATLALRQAEGARVIAEGALAVATGFAPDTPLVLAEWTPPDSPQLPSGDAAELMRSARDARPELLAAQAREQAAAAAVRAARGRHWPTLSLNANAGQTEIVDRGRTEQYGASVRLDLPLFSGFSVQGAIDQARATADLASADSDSLRRSVEQQVWVAWQNVRTARSSLEASRLQLKSAEQAADAIRSRYRTGLSSVLEVLSAESVLAEARVADIQSGVGWYQALATLGHDVGGIKALSSGDAPP